ncbi:MAG: hypothetical protein HWE23_04265 [Rhodobacteraceae bacterium]|nr:hypothetical protein [Paracoccaceae bacterium]
MMAASDLKSSKIQKYLKDLSPKAVESLVRNLERARDTGSADENVELILDASTGLLRGWEPIAEERPRLGSRRSLVERHFFSPLDEFLINEVLPVKQEARIEREALDRAWRWLQRDILPVDLAELLKDSEDEKVNDQQLERKIVQVRHRAIDAMSDYLEHLSEADKARRNLTIEMGGERGYRNLTDILKIFAAENWLGPFLDSIPDVVSDHELREGGRMLNMVKRLTSQHPDRVAIVAVALQRRAEHTASLCSFAIRLAGTDSTRALSKSEFSPFIDVVMSEADRLCILADEHRKYNPDPVAFARALEDYRALVSSIERDLDLKVMPQWFKRLAQSKTQVSSIVTSELGNVHDLVLEAIEVPEVDSQGNFERNTEVLDQAVRALHTLVLVGKSNDIFAVNDVSLRTRQGLEQALEYKTRSLMSTLGTTVGPRRDAVLMALDTAIQFSEIYYGSKFAQQLRRSRHSALAKEPELVHQRRGVA